MAHNLETSREYHDRCFEDGILELGCAAPRSGAPNDPWDHNKVLTIAGAYGKEIHILVRDGDDNPGLTVEPWAPKGGSARIEGQDLFALRELLNAMPEHAFTRPADPVIESEWADGDVVVQDVVQSWESRFDTGSRVWRRSDGSWAAANVGSRIFDKEVEDSIKYSSHQWTVVRKKGVDQ